MQYEQKSRNTDRGGDGEYRKHDPYYEEGSRSSRPPRIGEEGRAASAASGDQSPSSDDLIFNFRQALRRHAFSENEKSMEMDSRRQDASVTEDHGYDDESTVQKMERLRTARAKIEEQRKPAKVNSQSFATEYHPEQHQSLERAWSEKYRPAYEEQLSDPYEEPKQRQSTKLARQKMVSDELKARYMITRDSDREAEGRQVDSMKRSDRKDKMDKHSEPFEDKRHDADSHTSDRVRFKLDSEAVPTMEEMLLGSTKHISKAAAKKSDLVDHSSPFGSVYAPKSSTTSTSSSYKSEKDPEKMQKYKIDNTDESAPDDVYSPESRTPRSGKDRDRRRKQYQKAKSFELGALSGEDRVDVESSRDDTAIDSAVNVDDLDQENRAERIAKYKEERRKQMETIQKMFTAGDTQEMPSLFSRTANEEGSPMTRSKSLKVETDKRSVSPTVSRSKSLKVEREDIPERGSAKSPDMSTEMARMTSLRLAELGSNPRPTQAIYDSTDQRYNPEKIVDKIHALKTLKICQNAQRNSTEEAFKRLSKESKDSDSSYDGSLTRPKSYAGRTLLAERGMESTYGGSELTPVRDRVRSSSRESDMQDSSRSGFTKQGYGANIVEGHISDSSDASGTPKSKVYSDKEDRFAKFKESDKVPSKFEFGTVFQKKEKVIEKEKPVAEKPYDEKVESVVKDTSAESDLERTDSVTRVRRRLPSLEDVLGTNIVDRDKAESLHQQPEQKTSDKETNIKDKEPEANYQWKSKSAAEIRSKIKSPLDYAKLKFQEGERSSLHSDSSHSEIGTSYRSGKKERDTSRTSALKQRPTSVHVHQVSSEEMHGEDQRHGLYLPQPYHEADKITSESELSQSDMEVAQLSRQSYKTERIPQSTTNQRKEQKNRESVKNSQTQSWQESNALAQIDKQNVKEANQTRVIQNTDKGQKVETPSDLASTESYAQIQASRRQPQSLQAEAQDSSDRSKTDSLERKHGSGRPLSSPKLGVQKGELHKLAEQKFSRPNTVGNEAFAFGTVYGSAEAASKSAQIKLSGAKKPEPAKKDTNISERPLQESKSSIVKTPSFEKGAISKTPSVEKTVIPNTTSFEKAEEKESHESSSETKIVAKTPSFKKALTDETFSEKKTFVSRTPSTDEKQPVSRPVDRDSKVISSSFKQSSIGSQRSFESVASSVSDRNYSPGTPKQESQFSFEAKAQPVQYSTEKGMESTVPQQPKAPKHEPFIITTANLVSPTSKEPEGVLSPSELKALKIENISTSRTVKQMSSIDKEDELKKAQEIKVPQSPVEKQTSKVTENKSVPERQTSFTSFEVKTKRTEEKPEVKQEDFGSSDIAKQEDARQQTPEGKPSVLSTELKTQTLGEIKQTDTPKPQTRNEAKSEVWKPSVPKPELQLQGQKEQSRETKVLNEEKRQMNIKTRIQQEHEKFLVDNSEQNQQPNQFEFGTSYNQERKLSTEIKHTSIKQRDEEIHTKLHEEHEKLSKEIKDMKEDTKPLGKETRLKEEQEMKEEKAEEPTHDEIVKHLTTKKIMQYTPLVDAKAELEKRMMSKMSKKSEPKVDRKTVQVKATEVPKEDNTSVRQVKSTVKTTNLDDRKVPQERVTTHKVEQTVVKDSSTAMSHQVSAKSKETDKTNIPKSDLKNVEEDKVVNKKTSEVKGSEKSTVQNVQLSQRKDVKIEKSATEKPEMAQPKEIKKVPPAKRERRKTADICVSETKESKSVVMGQEKAVTIPRSWKIGEAKLESESKSESIEKDDSKPEKSKFQLMREKVAQQVLVKPKPLEPIEQEDLEKGKQVKPPTVEKSVSQKVEKTQITKSKISKSKAKMKVVDTSLDDILSKNVDYLTDLEPHESSKDKTDSSRSRPQSIHEHQSKTKRSFKKKVSSRRSKSEDRSRFKVSDDSD